MNPDTDSVAVITELDSQMIEIDGGDITLKDEGTQRHWSVTLQPFLMAKFSVTQEQYLFIHTGAAAGDDERRKPAIDVSWNDAVAFCNGLSRKLGLKECYSSNSEGDVVCDWDANGYRLPSEAEWEYACRAGTIGERYGTLDAIAWYRENSGPGVHEVGQKDPNGWGLHDMIGNVWEWCWDIYDSETYGSYRVFRGGGWSDPARGCRASCRRKSHPTFHIDDLGFRLARSLEATRNPKTSPIA